MDEAILSLRALTVRYGGVIAVDNVTFDVARGSFAGLIGPNGAGKTSLIDAITGFTRSTGLVLLDGEEINAYRPHHRLRRGLARTFQSVELFDDLTAAENILVGSYRGSLKAAWEEILKLHHAPWPSRLEELLDLLELTPFADERVSTLSTGRRRLVAVARALAAEPRVVLLDEPAAGLDTTESRDLGRMLRRVVEEGVTILMVDHDMSLILDVCDALHVLDFGSLIASGTPGEIQSNQAVITAYLGTTQSEEAAV